MCDCDCDQYEPALCRKCWDTFTNCDCSRMRLEQELKEAKKEIKELKKLLLDKIVKEKK